MSLTILICVDMSNFNKKQNSKIIIIGLQFKKLHKIRMRDLKS